VTLALPLNFESGVTTFALQFGLRDGFYPFREDRNASAVVTVTNVNDLSPVFEADPNSPSGVTFVAASNGSIASYSARVHEGTSANTTILRMFASDADAVANNAVRFRWENASAVPNLLQLNESSGVLSLRQLVFNIDFGDTTLIVLAVDAGGLFARAHIVVLYEDAFDPFQFRNTYVGYGGTFGVHGFGPTSLDETYAYHPVSERDSTRNEIRASLAYNPDGLWHDSRTFRAVLQAIDSESRVPQSQATVFVRVSPSNSFATALRAVNAPQSNGVLATCRTSTSQGMCTIAITLPLQWFMTSVAVTNVSVSYGEGSGSAGSVGSPLGAVTVNNRPTVSGTRIVILDMPFRGVRPGQRLNVPILANSVFNCIVASSSGCRVRDDHQRNRSGQVALDVAGWCTERGLAHSCQRNPRSGRAGNTNCANWA